MSNLDETANEIVEPNEEDVSDLDAILDQAIGGDGDQPEPRTEPEVSEPATEEPKDKTAEEKQATETVEPTVNEQDDPAIPQHWPARYRDALAKAPEDVRAAWQDHAKTLIGEATKAKQASAEFDRVFSPDWKQYIRGQGHQNEASFTRELLHLYATASNNPAQFVKLQAAKGGMTPEQYLNEIAKAAGVTLSGASSETAQEEDYSDPEISELRQHYNKHIQRLEAKIQDLGGYVSSQREQATNSVLEDFANTKDESGNPKYPHLKTVESDIAWILTSHPEIAAQKASDPRGALARAYDMAVRQNPQIYQQMVEAEKAAARRAEEVERAKRAGSAFSDTQPARQVRKDESLDDLIASAIGGAGA